MPDFPDILFPDLEVDKLESCQHLVNLTCASWAWDDHRTVRVIFGSSSKRMYCDPRHGFTKCL